MSDSTPPPASPYATIQPMSPSDEKLWATLIHVGGIFFWFLPSLIGYLVLKDRGPFVRAHSRTALNFQITMTIAYAVGAVLSIVVIGYLIVIAASIAVLIFSIIAAVAANNGQAYQYPVTIEFIK
ncbi:DUF4870 domain-containing protein [Salinibacterium sp. M195]|uniref:DUF4870 domain-containing protein n=1 Tax=Salinibacterium sp. M195 TaxID=2583374 RepID=UPI001C6363EA|nr:DUF4870 domain-containing protein [Salinibacterium sp. M195]QYH35942.1 DUF4870 domain-containing protein [Salinibacterium sp. M195]